MNRFILIVLVIVAACTGDVGPTGPAGTAGAQGPPGLDGPQGPAGADATVLWDIVTLDVDGSGAIWFNGTTVRNSVVNCYLGESAIGPWLLVAFSSDGTDAIACVVFDDGSDLFVAMVGGIPAWYFLATVATG